MEFTESKGPPTKEEAQAAILVVKKYMILGITKLPPELAVQMGSILRILNEYSAMAHERESFEPALDPGPDRRGTMINRDWGWCVVCGNERVDVSDGIDTCDACLKKG